MCVHNRMTDLAVDFVFEALPHPTGKRQTANKAAASPSFMWCVFPTQHQQPSPLRQPCLSCCIAALHAGWATPPAPSASCVPEPACACPSGWPSSAQVSSVGGLWIVRSVRQAERQQPPLAAKRPQLGMAPQASCMLACVCGHDYVAAAGVYDLNRFRFVVSMPANAAQLVPGAGSRLKTTGNMVRSREITHSLTHPLTH